MVLYFTGTGNSRYLARRIAEELEMPLYDLNACIKAGNTAPVQTGRDVVLVTPTYAWRIPRVVSEWLDKTELTGAERIWFVMDCGSEIGNAAGYNRQLAAQKQLKYMGTAQIIMPENYIAMFNAPQKEQAKSIVEQAEPVLQKVLTRLRAGQEFPPPRENLYDRFMSGPVNPVFYRFFVKADAFRATDACIGCGKCVELCPLSNIHLENGKPAGIDITTGNLQFHTSFFYDAQDRCTQEIQINTKTKKEIYKRTRTFDADGTIQSDSLKYTDGRLVLSSYNRQGKLIEEKEYNKDVMLSSTMHQYDSKGNEIRSQYVLPLPKNPLPTQISSQTDVYEYDKYGYLAKIISTQILVNNEKRVCSQYFAYDEFGNQIDSNMYYEYDQAGRWIRKTAKGNPEITEQIIIK